MDLSIESGTFESQDVDHREWQGNVHLREHGVSPVVDGILIACVQLSDKEVYDGEQVRYEYHKVADHARSESSHGKEEVNSCHGRDEAIHADILFLVHQSTVFPDA